ncbi:MAG: dGTPase [Campylobacterota bacterium]|nr:dGTPase [Campylobacterota bacterium]
MILDYKKRLTLHREFYPSKSIDTSVESDRGRILSSPAFRRLQKRTQVFALELNASIRTRLTHSLEVAQTARFIAKSILSQLEKEGLSEYGLEALENAFVSTAEMTSLLHDIGNPPFGHFAEQTINKWIEHNALPMLNDFPASTTQTQELKAMIAKDICNYDGNAQAIRVITKLQRLNLSYMQTLSVLKYTRGAFEDRPLKGEAFDYLKKKPGFYYSEKDFIEKIQQKLEVEEGHRFPLTYIMEAADDISYLTADLEDAVEKGILSLDEVYSLIKCECEKEEEDYLLEVIEERYKQAKQNEEPYQFSLFFALTRAKLVTSLVYHVVTIYVANHEAIFNGSFNHALLEYDKESKYYKAIKILQNISSKYIYEHKEVQTLELQGYTIVNGLLSIYQPLLALGYRDFEALLKEEKIECFISMRLIKRVSSKQISAYRQEVKSLDSEQKEQYAILEWYYRVRLIIDYISGMTDDFALDEYKVLMAMR